jgi:hypothetical protein
MATITLDQIAVNKANEEFIKSPEREELEEKIKTLFNDKRTMSNEEILELFEETRCYNLLKLIIDGEYQSYDEARLAQLQKYIPSIIGLFTMICENKCSPQTLNMCAFTHARSAFYHCSQELIDKTALPLAEKWYDSNYPDPLYKLKYPIIAIGQEYAIAIMNLELEVFRRLYLLKEYDDGIEGGDYILQLAEFIELFCTFARERFLHRENGAPLLKDGKVMLNPITPPIYFREACPFPDKRMPKNFILISNVEKWWKDADGKWLW